MLKKIIIIALIACNISASYAISVTAQNEFKKDNNIFLKTNNYMFVMKEKDNKVLGLIQYKKVICEHVKLNKNVAFYKKNKIEFTDTYALFNNEKIEYPKDDDGYIKTNLVPYMKTCKFGSIESNWKE